MTPVLLLQKIPRKVKKRSNILKCVYIVSLCLFLSVSYSYVRSRSCLFSSYLFLKNFLCLFVLVFFFCSVSIQNIKNLNFSVNLYLSLVSIVISNLFFYSVLFSRVITGGDFIPCYIMVEPLSLDDSLKYLSMQDIKQALPRETFSSAENSVAGGSSRTFLHDELLYKILLRLLRVGWGPPGYWGDLRP